MRLHLEQGCPEWKALRKTKVTGTDAASILGVNPFKSKEKLLKQKLGLLPDDFQNEAMYYGTANEPIARSIIEKDMGQYFIPSVHLHDENEWMMCSTDGISFDGNTILEIKCGKKIYELCCGQPNFEPINLPEYYYAQVQHNLFVSGANLCLFAIYYEGNCWFAHYGRDKTFIEKLIEKEKEFYDELISNDIDRLGFQIRNDEEWMQAVDGCKEYYEQMEAAEECYESSKKLLIELSSNKSTYGSGCRCEKITREGTIDYKAIPELQGVDLEKYRKEKTEYWKVSFDGK